MKKGFFPGEKGTDGKGRRAKDNKSGISQFNYRFDGTIGGNNYSYSLSSKDGAVTFKYESMVYPKLGEAETAAESEVLDRLFEAYLEYRLAEWDGYSKYNTMVCDGEGFSLSIRFNDGAFLFADGSNAFPPRYAEFVGAMSAILDPLRDRILSSADKEQLRE